MLYSAKALSLTTEMKAIEQYFIAVSFRVSLCCTMWVSCAQL